MDLDQIEVVTLRLALFTKDGVVLNGSSNAILSNVSIRLVTQ
jgi:hypothetical protein